MAGQTIEGAPSGPQGAFDQPVTIPPDVESKHAQRARRLLCAPDGLGAVVQNYEGLAEAYTKIVEQPRTNSFDEQMELLQLFLDSDLPETERVRSWRQNTLLRALGKRTCSPEARLGIRTLSDLVEQVKQYEGLGFTLPSLNEVIHATIEQADTYSIEKVASRVPELLESVPKSAYRGADSDHHTAVDELARLWLSTRLTDLFDNEEPSEDSLKTVIEQYASMSEAPSLDSCFDPITKRALDANVDEGKPVRVPTSGAVRNRQTGIRNAESLRECYIAASEDDATAELIYNAAEPLPFEAQMRADLFRATLDYDSSHIDACTEYLYAVARDTVENHRHGKSKPPRGEMMLAISELEAVTALRESRFYEPADGDGVWQESCYYVAQGCLNGSSWADSSHHESPDPSYTEAATAYMHAAGVMSGVFDLRAQKYRSKAFRYAAHAAEYEEEIGIHTAAKDAFFDFLASGHHTDRVQQVVQDRLRHHSFCAKTATVMSEFNAGNYETVRDVADDALALAEGIPINVKTSHIFRRATIAKGHLAEQNADYELARHYYTGLDTEERYVNDRLLMVEVKKAVSDGAFDVAVSLIEEMEGEHDLFKQAIAYLGRASPDDLLIGRVATAPALPEGTGTTTDGLYESDYERDSDGNIVSPMGILGKGMKNAVGTDDLLGLRNREVSALASAMVAAAKGAPVEEQTHRGRVADALFNI